MYPFKVTLCHTIQEEINAEQIEKLLIISKDILSEKGAANFSKEGNCIRYKNNFFSLRPNWNLMAYTDAGFIEIKKDVNNKTQIIYSVTFINVWIIGAIFSIIIFITTKDIYFPLIAFFGGGFLSWIVAVLRHWNLLFSIKDKLFM